MTNELPQQQKSIIFWTVLFIFPLIGMGIDLISPALPSISQSLHVTPHAAKFLIPCYLFAFAIGQPIFGAWSESTGRRPLLLVGLVGFIVASFICIFLTDIKFLCILRMAQGFFMGSLAVLGRMVLLDILSPEEMTRSFTWVATMWGIGPIIGPFVGGYLTSQFGWQANFYFFVLYTSVLLLILLTTLKETFHRKRPFSASDLLLQYKTILSHQTFIGYTLMMTLSFSMIVLFHTMAPFLIQYFYQQSTIFYGNIALGMGVCYFIATFICRYLLKFFNADQLITIAIAAIALTLISAFVLNNEFANNIWLIIITCGVCFFLIGFIFPPAMTKASTIFQQQEKGASNASAIMASVMLALSSFITMLGSRILVKNNEVLLTAFSLCTFLLIMNYWVLLRERVQSSTTKEKI